MVVGRNKEVIFWNKKKNKKYILYTVWYNSFLDLPGRSITESRTLLVNIDSTKNIDEVKRICKEKLEAIDINSDWKINISFSFITYQEE